MTRTKQITIDATYPDLTAAELWPVVGDLGGYAAHVPDLAASPIVSGDPENLAVGDVRECRLGDRPGWREDVVELVPGSHVRVVVRTETYPFPLRQLLAGFAGTWAVADATGGAVVTMTFDAELRRGWSVLWPVFRLVFRRGLPAVLDSYGEAARAMART